MTRREAVAAAFALSLPSFGAEAKLKSGERIRLRRLPNGGIQPQVMSDDNGILHVLYYAGDALNGDVFYTHSADGGATFSQALRVNSNPRSAIAAGTIRGPKFRLAKLVVCTWRGTALRKPSLKARLILIPESPVQRCSTRV